MSNLVVNEGNSVLTRKSHLWTTKMQRFLRGKKSLQLLLKTWKGSLFLKTHTQKRPGPVTESACSAVSRAQKVTASETWFPWGHSAKTPHWSLQQHPSEPQSCLFNPSIRSGSGKKSARYEDTVRSFTGTKCRLIEKSCSGKKSISQVEVLGLFFFFKGCFTKPSEQQKKNASCLIFN